MKVDSLFIIMSNNTSSKSKHKENNCFIDTNNTETKNEHGNGVINIRADLGFGKPSKFL